MQDNTNGDNQQANSTNEANFTPESPAVNSFDVNTDGQDNLANSSDSDQINLGTNSSSNEPVNSSAFGSSVFQSGSNEAPVFKKKKSLKPLIIGVGAVVLLGGSGVFAYTAYQNPQKVVTDSLLHLITAKPAIYDGQLTIKGGDVETTIDIATSKNEKMATSSDVNIAFKYQGESYNAKASAIYDESDNLYVKIKDVKSISAKMQESMGLSSAPESLTNAMNKLIEKVDNTWIKISSEDMKSYSEDYSKAQTCLTDTIDKYKDDSKAINEIADVYKKNEFIIVDKDLGLKDGNLGYELKGSSKKLKSFAEGLKDATIFKNLSDCDDSLKIDSSAMSEDDDSTSDDITIKLWANMWSHRVSEVSIEGKSDDMNMSMKLNPKFDQKVEVKAPSESITVTELQEYITEFTEAFSSQLYSTDYNYDSDYNYDL